VGGWAVHLGNVGLPRGDHGRGGNKILAHLSDPHIVAAGKLFRCPMQSTAPDAERAWLEFDTAPYLARAKSRRPRVAGVTPWGKSILLHGFQKQIVVPRGVALQFLLQKHKNIRNDLQFILHDVDRINLASREFR